ncbi:MAG: InlB B-repeat-containing protein, partial [Clostridia bacterium]|nr:InlB B-repeat-containing protein [Clostridia bacterium]
EVPVHPGYTGAWEAYELVPGGMTVNALYEINTYTVIYENTKDVLHGNPLRYVVTDETVVLADLAKDGYVFEGWYAGDVRVTEIAQGSTGDVVLTAKWTPIAFNVKLHFDPAWGKYAEGIKNPVTFTVEDTVVLEKLVCLIPGYVFDGWYTEKNVGEGGEIRELIAHVGDVELYAHFVPKVYTITYVGAEGATNVNPGMYTIESQAINLLPASKEGYIFGGWYLDEALSIPASLLIPEGSMGDMTLYTKWTPVTYTIEYDADGGVLPENPVVYNITQTLTLQAPTKAGYVFKGWYMAVEQKDELENDDGNESITEILVTQITPGMTGNLKLVARWTPIYYSITYHLYGGENPQMSMSDLLAGNLTGNLPLYTAEVPMIPLFPASKPGYKFEGWYSDPTYTSRVMMIQTSECKDVVLYAKWSLMTYKIEYVLPESAEHENIDSYTVLDGITVLLPATMPGYTFDGWYKDPEFKSVLTHIAGTGEYGDVTLYPKFVPESYHIWLGTEEADEFVVIFNYNNEEEQLVTQTVSMNQGLVFPEVPVRAGYLFAGWYESADFTGDVFDFSVPVVGNVTLHAKWIEASSIIPINTPVKVELNGLTEHKFTFVSLTNAVITIATEGDLDTRGTLCDADGKVLLTNDDASVTNKNFRIVFNAVAGKAYTIVVYAYSETIQGTVTLSVSGDTTVPAGGKAFLPNLFEVNSGENYHLPVPEAREGYKFLGWADVEGTIYTNGKGKSL